jgi:hypothetical protein
MPKIAIAVFVTVALLAAVGFIMAQKATQGPAGKGSSQGGHPGFGPMD